MRLRLFCWWFVCSFSVVSLPPLNSISLYIAISIWFKFPRTVYWSIKFYVKSWFVLTGTVWSEIEHPHLNTYMQMSSLYKYTLLYHIGSYEHIFFWFDVSWFTEMFVKNWRKIKGNCEVNSAVLYIFIMTKIVDEYKTPGWNYSTILDLRDWGFSLIKNWWAISIVMLYKCITMYDDRAIRNRVICAPLIWRYESPPPPQKKKSK